VYSLVARARTLVHRSNRRCRVEKTVSEGTCRWTPLCVHAPLRENPTGTPPPRLAGMRISRLSSGGRPTWSSQRYPGVRLNGFDVTSAHVARALASRRLRERGRSRRAGPPLETVHTGTQRGPITVHRSRNSAATLDSRSPWKSALSLRTAVEGCSEHPRAPRRLFVPLDNGKKTAVTKGVRGNKGEGKNGR